MALPNKAKIPVGTVLAGKYRITREIGRGGMAAVYEAENVDIGKRVAIKVLAQELTTSAIVVERFLREARAAAAIRSPYICDVYDSGRLEDGRPFLVLELLEGESLYERMTVIRYLDLETTVTVMSQVCRGLTKAHAASIVHRDLKPENIFLTKDEEGLLCAKILDFGLAKFYAPLDGTGDNKQARLTREGAVFGTPAYMSPEQVRGQGAVDHRADLWALGCITYECLTGRTVWQTEQGVAMTFAQIANAPLPRPATYRPDLPPSFTIWFDKALNRAIEKRFQTAREFADELSMALGVTPQSPRGMDISHVAISLPLDDEIPVDTGVESGPVGEGSDRPRRYSPSAPTHRPTPPTPAQGAAPEIPKAPGLGGLAAASNERQSAADAAKGVGPADAERRPPSLAERTPPATTAQGGAPLVDVEPLPRPRKGGAGRAVVLLGLLLLLAGGAYAGYRQFLMPPTPPLVSTTTTSTPTAPTAPDTTMVRDRPPPTTALPWATTVSEAQEAITGGDLKTATKLLKDAWEKGGHGVPRTMMEHVLVASKDGGKAPCQLTGLARPRTYDLKEGVVRRSPSGQPSIVVGPRGAVLTWTDAHEGSEHAYTAALDPSMRTAGTPIDVTPEGLAIGRPMLTAVGDRLVLTYWDAKGAQSGVHVRWLDGDGRIAGPAVVVASNPRGGNFWPTLAPTADGFFVAWSDELDVSSEDLFLRRLNLNLDLAGEVLRASDVAPAGSHKPRARYPSIAALGDVLHVAFRLEREPQHLIQHMRLPLADAGQGLPAVKPGGRTDRMLGEVALVNSDKAKSDGPAMACGGDACFIVWHGVVAQSGASAAYIDAARAQPLWHKKFTKTGTHPAVAVAPTGEAQIVWYEGGRVSTASITRDGIGPATRIARISGDQPMPSIAAGAKRGEWYLAWLDYEAGTLEPYAARVSCR